LNCYILHESRSKVRGKTIISQSKEREKKIKPIKQPTKLVRPPILLDKMSKQDDSHLRMTDKDGKSKNIMGNSQPSDEHKNNNRETICTTLL
jgi:hypothetical protein